MAGAAGRPTGFTDADDLGQMVDGKLKPPSAPRAVGFMPSVDMTAAGTSKV
jgi:hypothetical protein